MRLWYLPLCAFLMCVHPSKSSCRSEAQREGRSSMSLLRVFGVFRGSLTLLLRLCHTLSHLKIAKNPCKHGFVTLSHLKTPLGAKEIITTAPRALPPPNGSRIASIPFRVLRFCRCYVFAATLLQPLHFCDYAFAIHKQLPINDLRALLHFWLHFCISQPLPEERNSLTDNGSHRAILFRVLRFCRRYVFAATLLHSRHLRPKKRNS
jgi:hypothetical protein